jgi:hypothetical protein
MAFPLSSLDDEAAGGSRALWRSYLGRHLNSKKCSKIQFKNPCYNLFEKRGES